MNPDKFSPKSRQGSFKYAFSGLSYLLTHEHNARIHSVAAVIVIILGFALKVDPVEWCMLIIVTGLVFLTELINSSLEAIADVAESRQNEKIRIAKDYSAAAVLISAIISVIVGGLIFIPRLLSLI
jgi:diacylglycerol kinase (ATP)